MGPRNVLLGVLVYLSFTLPLVKSIGELIPFLVIHDGATPNPILHSDIYMHNPNELQLTVRMDDADYNNGKIVALCFVSYASDINYVDHPNICPTYSRILITATRCSGSGSDMGCRYDQDSSLKKYDVVIKNKDGKWTATVNGVDLDLYAIAKFGQGRRMPSVRAAMFSVAMPLVTECVGVVSDACKQDKDRATIVNGQLNNPAGGSPPTGAREHTYPPDEIETTTEAAEEEDEDTAPAASARFPYEIFIVLGVILVFLIGIVLGVKLVTKKWIWQLCPCCKKQASDNEAKRRRVIDGSDEEKRSVSGDMKGPEAGSATNNGPQSENQGPGALESSDVKVSFAPGSKENQRNAQPPPPAPPIITAESPVPSPATTPPANNAPPPAAAAPAPPAPPPPPPEAPKKKKKKKKNDKDSSSSTESGTTGTTTADTKAPKEPPPKAPNLIVVTKEGELENDAAKAKDKVQKNYNEVRQQTAVTQDPGLAVQTGRTKTNMPLATGKPAATAVGTARPRDKTKTQLATGLAKQETDLNDPTEVKKEDHVDGGELQVAETQREVGDDAITGRGATVMNTGRGATGRGATTAMATGRGGTVVATGKTGTIAASQGTQAGTDIDGEHQPGGDLIPVTAAGTRPTQAATITKTRGVSGTQPGDETAEVLTGRGRTTRTKGVSNTQGTKVTEGGYETRPTQVESKEPGSSLRTGRGKTHLTHAGLMTAATQGLTGGTGGTQGTQDATAFTGRTATRVTGATQMPSSLEEGETQFQTGGGGRTGTTQMQSQTTQGGAGTTQTRAGTRTTQAATRTRTQAGTQNTQGGTGGGTQGTQDPTMAYATGKTQTYATGATQMPSTNETGETQVPTGTQPGRSGTTQGQTGTTQIGTKTQTVGARTSGTQAGTGGQTGTTQGATATTQGGAGTATTQKRTTRPTAE
uniref:ZP domain-containing protein n=1 Tax=Panagrellus redivivus TaxID=6233 RepID=A0A7E4ZU40_PANRE